MVSTGPDLAGKLEAILRGEILAEELDDVPPLEGETPQSSTVSTASTSGSSTTPATSHPESSPPAPSSSTSTPPVRRSTEISDALSYERERQATIARNQEILKRLIASEKFADVANILNLKSDTGDAGADEVEVPAWVVNGKEYLLGVSDATWWTELVTLWYNFERELEYPDGQVCYVVLPRPSFS